MKRILILIIGLIGVAQAQYAPTSAKSRFVNGLALGTKLDSYFAAADSNALYWRADSVVMAKYKGTARALAFAVSGGYLPILDTAAMLSGLSLDRVLANGNTSGRNLTAGNASFTTVTTNLGRQSSTTPFNIPVQNAITGTLEAAIPDSIRTYQGLRPRPWRYDGGNGNRLANTAYGLQVLDSVTEGTHPILIGKIPDTATADAEFQGRFNTAIGPAALPVARYVSDFTVLGANVAASMDSGFYSTLVGHNVLNKSTNGSKVTSVGAFALLESTNIVNVDNFGFEGMRYNQTGSFNSNFGAKGMLLNSTGNYNFSGGYQGMFLNTTGSNNTNIGALGLIDLKAVSDSISNFSDYSGTVAGTVKATSVGHGRSSGQNLIISGTTNYDGTYPITVINSNEFYFTKTYVANDSIGWWTLQGAEAKNNTSVGYNAGAGLISGSANTIIGATATLSPTANNNIVISDGDGNTRLQHDSIKWVSNSLINYDYNRSGTFTGNSLTNKTYVDSLTSGISSKLNISDTAAMLANRLKISDTATMLSGYRLKSVPIGLADLQFFQISGISLGNNLFNLNTPYGLVGTNYNGSSLVNDWAVDTTIISTKANVTGSLVGYATTGSLNSYKLISDTFFSNGYTTRARTKQLSDSLAATKLNLTGGTLSGALNGTTIVTSDIIASDNGGNAFNFSARSANIGTVGNWVAYAYGFTGTTYQKGATFFESMDANGRGKFHIALNSEANSSNVTLSDSKFNIDYTGAATFSSSVTATQFNLFANNKVSNQTTSQTITSYTVPSDGLYLCSGSIVFTANSGSGTQLQVEWTQAETNTVGTCALTPAITGVFPVNGTPVSVYAKAGTIIYIKSLILGGTATYSASGTIQLIKAY